MIRSERIQRLLYRLVDVAPIDGALDKSRGLSALPRQQSRFAIDLRFRKFGEEVRKSRFAFLHERAQGRGGAELVKQKPQ